MDRDPGFTFMHTTCHRRIVATVSSRGLCIHNDVVQAITWTNEFTIFFNTGDQSFLNAKKIRTFIDYKLSSMRDKGICLLSAAALRKAACHRSEMVSQLLFGDMVQVIDIQNDWLYIEMAEDKYPGWVAKNQLHMLDEADYSALLHGRRMITASLSGTIRAKAADESPEKSSEKDTAINPASKTEETFAVTAGCTFYANSKGAMVLSGSVFEYDGTLLVSEQRKNHIPEFALRFQSTPYLWGGRSASGLDCSGFTQLIYKMAGISIPRDAAMQAQEGETVHLINEAEPGDLVFFDNEEGIITHTGILLDESTVIHAHGKVRIDNIDHHGIFNRESRKYSHNLRIIKRF